MADGRYPVGISRGERLPERIQRVRERERDECRERGKDRAGREFRGSIDYRKLRVAAGQLVPPSVSTEVDAESRKVRFASPGVQLESIDCFLDDKIYGVVAGTRGKRCRVVELGTRGEAIDTSVDFPRNVEADEIVVYVFAASADGKDVSDSVCLHVSSDEI